jgi:hypothetical protein
MYNDLDPKRMKVPLLIHLILGVRKTSWGWEGSLQKLVGCLDCTWLCVMLS